MKTSVPSGSQKTIPILFFIEIDLEEISDIYAIQVNFQDFNAEIFGKPDTLKQQFIIETSVDRENWQTTVDHSKNERDQPHAYIELETFVAARYVRFRNLYFPNKYLGISEFRVFGKGRGDRPFNTHKISKSSDRKIAETPTLTGMPWPMPPAT